MDSKVTSANRILRLISLALLLTVAAGVQKALADPPLRSETVKFRDLDLNTPEGVQALYTRIHTAAKRVCADSDPIMAPAIPGCIRDSEAAAVEKVGLAQLTAYYKAKKGEHDQRLVAAR